MRGSRALLSTVAPAIGLVALAVAIFAAPAAAATRPATIVEPLGHPRPFLGSRGQSPNWAGYDVTEGGPFTSVAASWIQPLVRSSSSYTDTAFWVGLDGDTSDPVNDPPQTVEQIGTEGYTLLGHVFYDAWYELYPSPAQFLNNPKHKDSYLPVRAGDHLSASVVWNPAGAGAAGITLTLVNHTTGKTFTKFIADSKTGVAPVRSSVEVIVEAPSLADGAILSLARFGLVTFRGCAFEGRSLAGFDWSQIDMVSPDNGAAEAVSTALSPDGTAFRVTTDFKRPVTTVSGAAGWHGKPVTLRFKATDDRGGTGVAYTQYSRDAGATWTTGRSVTVPAPRDHSADGATVVWFRSADRAGNLERKRACTVYIDTRPPVPVAKWPLRAVRGRRATLRFFVGDRRPGSPTVTATLRFRDAAGRLAKKVVLSGCRVDKTLTYGFVCLLAKGRYRVVVSATDAAGNPGSVAPTTRLVVR